MNADEILQLFTSLPTQTTVLISPVGDTTYTSSLRQTSSPTSAALRCRCCPVLDLLPPAVLRKQTPTVTLTLLSRNVLRRSCRQAASPLIRSLLSSRSSVLLTSELSSYSRQPHAPAPPMVAVTTCWQQEWQWGFATLMD